MSGDERPQYAERLFPAPIEHGIAREERAVEQRGVGCRHRRARVVAGQSLV